MIFIVTIIIIVYSAQVKYEPPFCFRAMTPEQERLIAILKDTMSLLCKNSLTFNYQVQVQGLICITVDKQDVLVVPVHESIGQAEYEPCVACGHAKEPPPGHRSKRKRRRRSSAGSKSPSAASDQNQDSDDDENGEVHAKIKKEVDSGDEDLILISEDFKKEDESFITGYMDNSQFASITAAPQTTQDLQQQHLTSPQHQQHQLTQQQPQQQQQSWINTSVPSTSSQSLLADATAAVQRVGLSIFLLSILRPH